MAAGPRPTAWHCRVLVAIQLVRTGSTQDTDRRPVAAYTFSGGNADDSAGSRHGEVTGATAVPDRFGTAAEAFEFDGDDFITVDTPFTEGDNDFSIALWLKPTIVNDESWHSFCGYQAGGVRSPSAWVNWNGGGGVDAPEDFGMQWDTRTTQGGDGTRFHGVVNGMFEQDVYVHVVWTAVAGDVNSFYKNGDVGPSGSVADAGAVVDLADQYWIGKTDSYFSGVIDDVAFYSFALSAADVSAIFTASTGSDCGGCGVDTDGDGGISSSRPTGFTYIGCFADAADRDLANAIETDSHADDDSLGGPGRIMACATACATEYPGSKYMGLQSNDECYCGNDYGSQGEVDMSDCDGDGVLTGGVADGCGMGGGGSCGWTNAVYQINYRGTRGNEMDTTDCVVAHVGRGPKDSPTPVAAGYICPATVDQTNWLGGETTGLIFAVAQDATGAATVTRTDKDEDRWPLDLRFRCCKASAAQPYLYMGCFVDAGGDDRLMIAPPGDDAQLDEYGARTITPGDGALDECAAACSDFAYMGLHWTNECFCGNEGSYGAQGEADSIDCDSDGDVSDGIADLCGNGQENCGYRMAVYRIGEQTQWA